MRNSKNIVSIVRSFHINAALEKKVIVSNLKGKSVSSQHWLTRQLKDPYVEKAKMLNYRLGKINSI